MSGVSGEKSDPAAPKRGSIADIERRIEEATEQFGLEPGYTDIPDPMTREELNAYLEANEARVEEMTTRVEEQLSAIDEKIDARLSQIDEVDKKMEEREERLFERVRSSLEEAKAGREESIGELREEIGKVRGEFEAVKGIAEANFRNRRIMIGAVVVTIAVVQILVAVFIG